MSEKKSNFTETEAAHAGVLRKHMIFNLHIVLFREIKKKQP